MKFFHAVIVILLAVAANTSSVIADDTAIAKQFVNATTIVIAKIDSNRIGLPDSLTKGIADDKNQVLQRGANPILLAQQEFVKALDGESVFIAVDIPFSSVQSPVRLLVRNKTELDQKKLYEQLSRFQFTKPVVLGDYLCYSMFKPTESSSKIAISDNVMTSTRPDLQIAMQSVEEFPVQILVLPPDYLWKTFRDLMPTIPTKFGGGPSTLLTEGVRWTAIGIDPPNLRLQAITQSMSSEAASATASHLPKLLEALAGQLRLPLAKGGMEQLLLLVKPVVSGDRMTISINGLPELDQSVAFLSSAMEQILGPFTSQNNLDRFKQIGLAIHNYESANKVLPPSKEGRDADGKSILSWRVHLLPYVGELELYKQFRLKEPWNSKHNLTLLDKMPDIFKGSASGFEAYSDLKPGYTTFLAPVGDDTIFGGAKPVKFGDVRDGVSNTIWLVEVKAEFAKPWTSPEDYVFDVANPAKGLAEIAGDKPSFLGALGDGSVTKFPLSLPPKTLLHLFQKADGNGVTW